VALLTSLADARSCVPLYLGFANGTAAFQFVEHAPWIPVLNSQYTHWAWTASPCR
jgi:NADH:ubiquinone oxidoreductase subunit 4 (subunit M)